MTTVLQREVASYKGVLPECPYCHKGLCELDATSTEVFRVCSVCGGTSSMTRGAFRKYVRRINGQKPDLEQVVLTNKD